MAKREPICPVCNQVMKPTWVKELGGWQGSPRRVPMDPRCPSDCAQTVEPAVYNAALKARDQRRRDEEQP